MIVVGYYHAAICENTQAELSEKVELLTHQIHIECVNLAALATVSCGYVPSPSASDSY